MSREGGCCPRRRYFGFFLALLAAFLGLFPFLLAGSGRRMCSLFHPSISPSLPTEKEIEGEEGLFTVQKRGSKEVAGSGSPRAFALLVRNHPDLAAGAGGPLGAGEPSTHVLGCAGGAPASPPRAERGARPRHGAADASSGRPDIARLSPYFPRGESRFLPSELLK